MERNFLEEIGRRPIVCDGAMGTMLYARGIYINQCYDAVNLSSPHIIKSIHLEYLQAGAEVIETNTFGANRRKLGCHGLADKVREINLAGVRLTQETVEDKAWIAGAVGPVQSLDAPDEPVLTSAERKSLFREQIEALVEGGVDLLILETFDDLEEIADAVAAAHETAPDLPLVGQMVFLESGATSHGASPETVAQHLRSVGVDVVGANCGAGPERLLTVVERLTVASPLPVSVQPNAGHPVSHEGRCIYLATPDYFTTYARRMIAKGARMLGACCGSGPEHIRGIAAAVRMLQTGDTIRVSETPRQDRETASAVTVSPTKTPSRLAAKLRSGDFAVSVEIDPPMGTDPRKALEAAKRCGEAGIDCVNIADGPRASPRMGPIDMAVLMKGMVGQIEPMVHFCCRDRNLLGLQADLLGANALGIRNILIVTGDPPKLGAYPFATSVYDVDAVGAIKIAKGLTRGHDLAGTPLSGPPAELFIGAGANPGAIDLDFECDRLTAKVKAGAEYVLTQPVYDFDLFAEFCRRIEGLNIPVMVGILPLASYRNAEFLHREVPGMQIPKHIRERMRRTPGKEEARREGIAIARESLRQSRALAQGCYIMPPFNRIDSALAVLEGLS